MSKPLNIKSVSSLELRLAALAEWAENHQTAGLIAYRPDHCHDALGVIVIPCSPYGPRRELVSIPGSRLSHMLGEDVATLLLEHFRDTGIHVAAAVRFPRNIVLMTTEPADDVSLELANRFGSVVDDAITYGEDQPIVTDVMIRATTQPTASVAETSAPKAEPGDGSD
ncbi:MAG: hypothetical protein AAF656_00355 [Planctomycetota bacterium]